MNTYRYKKPRVAALLAAMTVACALPTYADILYWGSDTSQGDTDLGYVSWQDSTHWFTNAAGTTGATAAPGATDDAVFSITSLNGITQKPRINANTTIRSITFNNTAALNLEGHGGNRTLELGSGGITLNSSGVTIGTTASSRNVFVRIAENQTWTNNSSGGLTIRNNARASDLSTGPLTLTMNAAGSGNIGNSGAFADGANSSLALVIDSTGSGVVSIQSSTHSGGTTIKRGIMQANGANIGTTAVQLGDTGGTGTATLRINTTAAITTDLNVVAGNSDSKTLEFTSTSGAFNSNIVLNDALHIGVRASSGATGATINGDISGSGDLIKGQYQGGNSQILTLAGTNTYSGDTIIDNGAFTLADTGSLTFYIGENGDSNGVTGTSTGAINFVGSFNFDTSNADKVLGNTWTIVSDTLTNVTYGPGFSVSGFEYDSEDGLWKTLDGQWEFSTASGLLTYAAVPEPSTYALLAGAGALVLGVIRRRKAARA